MRILVVGTGGVGAAFAAIAQRRSFFDRITLADLDPARPQARRRPRSASTTASARRASTPPSEDALDRADPET